MTEAEARSKLEAILADLGVRRGDILYLAIDMGQLPLPYFPAALSRKAFREREQKWCEFLFDVLMDIVGAEGTILAPTFTYAYAAHQKPYIHEESPSETGPFTEFLRRRPEAVRSLHPLHSVVGIGAHAAELLEGLKGKAAYGALSVFARLETVNVRFLCLGASLGASLTYAHHLEQLYGVNHRYTKIFNVPVLCDGAEVTGPWLCFMKYLGTPIRANVHALEHYMRSQGTLRVSELWDHPAQLAERIDVENAAFTMLAENPWAFTKEPIEIHIETNDTRPQMAHHTAVRFYPAAHEPGVSEKER